MPQAGIAPFVCTRCKQRKGKCDKALPQCGFCPRFVTLDIVRADEDSHTVEAVEIASTEILLFYLLRIGRVYFSKILAYLSLLAQVSEMFLHPSPTTQNSEP